MADVNLWSALPPAIGMLLAAAIALLFWRYVSKADWKWFWLGAGLWIVAVVIKLALALAINSPVTYWLRHNLSYPAFIAATGLFLGVVGSACEIGFTIIAVAIWRQLGRDAGRAIAIGVGAGAIEAFLLGSVVIVSVAVAMTGLPGGEEIREGLTESQSTIPLFWLIGPVERTLALLIHASTRSGLATTHPQKTVDGFEWIRHLHRSGWHCGWGDCFWHETCRLLDMVD